MKRHTLFIILLCLATWCGAHTEASAQDSTSGKPKSEVAVKIERRLHRFDRELQRSVFVPKGTWMGGMQISYGNHQLENINMLVLKDLDMSSTSFGLSPCVGYFFRNNTCAGLRFNYNYSRLNLNNMDLNLGEDFNISLKDLYYLEKNFKMSAFMRNYVPLSRSKVFAFFSEVQLSYGHSTGQNSSGSYADGNLDATFARSNSLHLGFAPGLTAFVQDWMAVEVQAGVVGFGFNWQEQTHNQVETGKVNSFSGRFKVDLFSIAIGTTIYL